MNNYRILDWAGNLCFTTKTFKTFEDGEAFLSRILGNDYETDRQEYYIEECNVRPVCVLDPHGSIRFVKEQPTW